MPGVEILNTEVIVTETGGFNITAFIITIFFCALIGFIIGLTCSLDDYSHLYGFVLGILIGLILGAFMGIGFQKPIIKNEEVVYKVIISDEVSFNEFYEKYEILQKEGEIYTITERKE